ncbi:MAG: tetratricopeptide repeat protein, partial [Tannerella sp.]|nr:tetratricopeptide repeat protein [Tannerella sp.]
MKLIGYLIIVMALFPVALLQTVAGQTVNVDSLKNVVETGGLKAQFEALDKLSAAFLYSDINRSLKYAREHYRMAKQAQDIGQQGFALSNLAKAYNYSGNADSSLYYFDAAYQLLEQTENEEKLSKLRIDRSSVKIRKFLYEEALDDLYKSQDYYEQSGDKKHIPLILLRIGSIYFFSMSDYDMAEKYFRKGLEMEERLGTDEYKGSNMGNLAAVKAAKREFDEAIDYCRRSIENFRKNDNRYNTGRMLYIMAEILREAGRENENAIGYLNEAMDIAEQTDNQSLKEEVMRGRAAYYLAIKNIPQAQKEAETALTLADTSSYTVMATYKYLFTCIAIYRKHPEEALLHLKDYLFYLEKEQSEETKYKITEKEVKYETEKKQLKITALEEEKRLMQWLSIAGATVLLLALASFFFLWRWTVQKKRVAEKQRQFAEQQVRQLEQERQLVATQSVLDGETQERTRLARDLHDGLGGMLTGVKVNLENIKNDVGVEPSAVACFENAMGILSESMLELRRVAHHLMPETLSRYGLKPAISDFCRSLSPIIVFDWFGYETRLDQKLEVVIYRIIHELVNNALKYSGASQIMVQIMQEDD